MKYCYEVSIWGEEVQKHHMDAPMTAEAIERLRKEYSWDRGAPIEAVMVKHLESK